MSKSEYSRQNMIADYVRGALDEPSRHEVERKLLEDPAWFGEACVDALLRRGLIETDLRESTDESLTGPGRHWSGRIAMITSSVLVVCVLGLSGLVWDLKRQLREHRMPKAGVPVISLLEQRAMWPSSQEDFKSDTVVGPALIEVDVSVHGDAMMNVELEYVDRRRYMQRVRPDDRGYVTVLVPSGESVAAIRVADGNGDALMQRRFGPY